MPRRIRDAIVAHARERDQVECCGLVAGRDRALTRVIRCRNIADTPAVRYRIDPREQLAAIRTMDAAGEDLVAIYHSHPASIAFPSPTDRAEAFYPEVVHFVISLRGAPEIRAFRIAADHPGSEKTVRELEIIED